MKKFKKIERHTVIYTDIYEVPDEEFKYHFRTWEEFLDSEELEVLEQWKVDAKVDEISNRQGTAEVEWYLEEKEE